MPAIAQEMGELWRSFRKQKEHVLLALDKIDHFSCYKFFYIQLL